MQSGHCVQFTTFSNIDAKKFYDNLNSTIFVLYKQCMHSLFSSKKGNLCSSGNKRDKIIKISGGMCLGTEVAQSQLPGQWD